MNSLENMFLRKLKLLKTSSGIKSKENKFKKRKRNTVQLTSNMYLKACIIGGFQCKKRGRLWKAGESTVCCGLHVFALLILRYNRINLSKKCQNTLI